LRLAEGGAKRDHSKRRSPDSSKMPWRSAAVFLYSINRVRDVGASRSDVEDDRWSRPVAQIFYVHRGTDRSDAMDGFVRDFRHRGSAADGLPLRPISHP
jgi:hypothetical protein